MISIPRLLLVGLAAIFSAFHLVLGISALDVPANPWPGLVAMLLYALATVFSLVPSTRARMPAGVAAGNVAVTAVSLILVLPQLEPHAQNGYATWIVGAIGTLMTITVVRQRPLFAWTGIGVMIVGMLAWVGDPFALPALGVIGGPVWVGIGHAATAAIVRATRDARLFELAEQRAVEWQAQEQAEFFERRVRLAQMDRTVAPMLKAIIASDGRLDEEERQECLHLEAAMRDEIRGRRLLDDRVRREVMEARRRGVEVTLLDDGGIDDLDRAQHARVTAVIAEQIGGSTADRLVVRTGRPEDDVAVTIVGLRDAPAGEGGEGDDAMVGGVGQLEEEAELELWLEVPREAGTEKEPGTDRNRPPV
ncbi:hypothetical protein ACEXQB_014120 [Herbiconiux sp. P18]|uniref:hypothetical protein n=1 Tax=Herbiconiux liangxiaofengii TaxID=3342795 RepID=UPI0035B6F0E1